MLLVGAKKRYKNLSKTIDCVISSCSAAQNTQADYLKSVKLSSIKKIQECQKTIRTTYNSVAIRKLAKDMHIRVEDFFERQRLKAQRLGKLKLDKQGRRKRNISAHTKWSHILNIEKRPFGTRWIEPIDKLN